MPKYNSLRSYRIFLKWSSNIVIQAQNFRIKKKSLNKSLAPLENTFHNIFTGLWTETLHVHLENRGYNIADSFRNGVRLIRASDQPDT